MTACAPTWTLLAVDDEPNILSALRRVFRATGWRVLTAGHAREALEVLGREPVDAVLSDMRMPDMDGVQLLERVGQGWPDTARLLITGQADVASTIAAINRGQLHRYITKPWNDDELVLTLQEVATRQRLEADKRALERLTQEQNDALKTINAELEARVAQRTEELVVANEGLKRSYMSSIKAFTALIELRGSAHAGHARRVADLARRIAKAMGPEGPVTHDLPIAALLHDIGHIGLSDTVLARPVNRLDGDDLQRYRLHPVLGEQALLSSDTLQGVAPLIRAHHERWDGRGFPDGLRGAEVPLGARVLAVADAFEDLCSGRVDGRSLARGDAQLAVLAGRGSQFDPVVVDAFASLSTPVSTAARLHLRTAELHARHVLATDFVSPEGVLMLAAGQPLNDVLITRIRHFERQQGTTLTLAVQPLEEAHE